MVAQPLTERRDYGLGKQDQLEKNYYEIDPSLITDELRKQFDDRVEKIANQIITENIVHNVLRGESWH